MGAASHAKPLKDHSKPRIAGSAVPNQIVEASVFLIAITHLHISAAPAKSADSLAWRGRALARYRGARSVTPDFLAPPLPGLVSPGRGSSRRPGRLRLGQDVADGIQLILQRVVLILQVGVSGISLFLLLCGLTILK